MFRYITVSPSLGGKYMLHVHKYINSLVSLCKNGIVMAAFDLAR